MKITINMPATLEEAENIGSNLSDTQLEKLANSKGTQVEIQSLSQDGPSAKINQSAIKGEPGTGYEDSIVSGKDMGDFSCSNCEYFDSDTSSCGQADMMAKSKQPRIPSNGRVMVKPKGCCEYVDRIGER
jgi:hypothetical protein